MYWPSVLSIPFGPGPNRTMLVNPSVGQKSTLVFAGAGRGLCAPKMKPMIKPTAGDNVRLRVCVCLCLLVRRTSTHHTTHLHCILSATAMCVCVCAQTEAYACQELKGHARPGALSQLVRASWGLFDGQVQEERGTVSSTSHLRVLAAARPAPRRDTRNPGKVWPWAQPHRHTLEANRLATAQVPS